MYVPCHTCKDRGACRDEEITCREAIFAVVNGTVLECPDHREDSYHGVAGCVDTHKLLVVNPAGDLPGVRGRAGRYGMGVPLFLGAR